MLHAVDDRPAPIDCEGVELRWLTRADGSLAGHHTLRALSDGAGALWRGMPLPRWSVTSSPWASTLRWETEIRPLVLRRGDPLAERLDIADTAPALVILERGGDAAGAAIEHELIVLAAFASRALPRRGGHHIRGLESA